MKQKETYQRKCIYNKGTRARILFVFAVATLLPAFTAPLTARTITGTVFSDANGNGIRDKGEAVLAGIPVSNGRDIVLTNAQGLYRITVNEGNSLFPILPADYTMSGARVVNAAFVPATKIKKGQHHFALKPKTAKRQFRLNAVGDVQVSNHQELDYAARTLWPELMATDSADINLFLGDLVNNNLSLYTQLRQMMELLPSQTFTVLGNHDRDADSIPHRQTRSYKDVFGSDVYAFNEGQVHFIVLNNVYPDGARGYHGQLTSEQLAFVENDLRLVPDNRLICLSMHIPLIMTRNRSELLSLLKGRKEVLAITGHLHRVMRFIYGEPDINVHELGAGATCGFWWVGERDWDGIPSALQQGGTPRNYFVVDFTDNTYRLRCKAVGLDERRQMNIHITGIDTLDTHLPDLRDIPSGRAIITVWGGCLATQVRVRIDNGVWQKAVKVDLIAPNVARMREINHLKIYPTRFSRLNPLRRQPSPQVWILPLPAPFDKGTHRIEVEASDQYGFGAHGQRAYCLTD